METLSNKMKIRLRRTNEGYPELITLSLDTLTSESKQIYDILDSIGKHSSNSIQFCGHYFGLRDKNGKDVFVGDILETQYGFGRVCYDEQYFQYFILILTPQGYGDSIPLDNGFEPHIEVVGNIYSGEELTFEK